MSSDYSHKFVRVTISGTLLNGAEEWSTGFQLGSPTADMVDAQAPAAESIATAWQTFFTSGPAYVSSSCKTTQVKLALINTDGKTDVDAIDYYTYPAPIAGTGPAVPYPPQITLAATLTSDFQRGLASKGRMYLPGLVHTISADSGKIEGPSQANLATAFKTFLDSVNTGAGVPGKVVIASKGRDSKQKGPDGQPIYLGGRTAWVTGCRIGDIYDTQRRRRNGLAETYVTRVLA